MTDTDKQKRKIWIFGTVPEPVGGVAIFLQRLIASQRVPLGGLVDPYFGAQKISLTIPHWYPKKVGILYRIWTLMKLFRLRNQKLFINGSRPESILALFPFLLFRSAKKSLLLHHGELLRSIENSRIKATMVKIILRGYDRIFCLSEKQRRFYIANGVDESRLILVNSYIGLPETCPDPKKIDGLAETNEDSLSQQAREAIAWVSQAGAKVIIGSGYAHSFYNHAWVLDYLEQESHITPDKLRYILCCYGPKTEYLRHLRKRFVSPNVKLCFGLSPQEFNAVLSRSDIYVRPTSIDSFGIAIHDARALGLQVIASDACERPNDVLVHRTDDYDQFRELLKKCLDSCDFKEDHLVNLYGDIAERMTIIDALNT